MFEMALEPLILHDLEPASDAFKAEVLEGLRQTPKRIPSKFFYDERGSKLFEEITTLDEYYLTRTELAILREHLPEIARLIGSHAQVIEFGTGAGIKTRLLLGALDDPALYVPIDISREQLLEASLELLEAFPDLEVTPVLADYTGDFSLPTPRMIAHPGQNERTRGQTVIFYPGSTIGNFTPDEAIDFLRNISLHVKASTTASLPLTLLIGFDRKKDRRTLEAAYNDSKVITAAFNLNLITRIAKEFDIEIDPQDFQHYAYFNELQSRIEMHLVSKRELTLVLDDESIQFVEGEHIVTEYSYKFSPEAFLDVIEKADFERLRTWTDTNAAFDLWLCRLKA